jgi:hypothetical protein
MFKQEVLLGGGGPTLTFNKSGEEEEEGEEGITADRFYKGVRQVLVPTVLWFRDIFTCRSADSCL